MTDLERAVMEEVAKLDAIRPVDVAACMGEICALLDAQAAQPGTHCGGCDGYSCHINAHDPDLDQSEHVRCPGLPAPPEADMVAWLRARAADYGPRVSALHDRGAHGEARIRQSQADTLRWAADEWERTKGGAK